MKTMILKEIADFVMFDFNAMKEAKAKENIDTNELPTTVRTTIGDTEVEFTPAFTDYSMEHPKKERDSAEKRRCRQANGGNLPFRNSRGVLERRCNPF